MCSQNICKIANGLSFITNTEKFGISLQKKLPVISNEFDEIIGFIKEFKEIDRKTKNLIYRVNHVLRMLVNLSLTIRYCPSLRSRSNLMVLVKVLPTYT